ncbi:MAG TPA: DNRLRE domain-containing protein [Anaerolineaceae bacterium]|nr:DNRLRE domain-containing protein [Anaerolineaceae bacterium]
MGSISYRIAVYLFAGLLLVEPATGSIAAQATNRLAGSASNNVYIPMVSSDLAQPGTRLNVPIFAASGSADTYFSQAAITWFGQVSANSSYADVRVASTQTELAVYVSVFDRMLWYSTQPSTSTLTQYDSATLYLSTAANRSAGLNATAYRFDSQFSWYESRSAYQASYRGSGSSWSASPVNFTTTATYRGIGGPNSGQAERGWVTFFHIPYASLGLSGPPSAGTPWGMALTVHNRDSQAGPPLPDVSWPEAMNASQPASWAGLHFGMPGYTPPAEPTAGTTTIRNLLNGVSVPDGTVGGTVANQCSGDETYIWNGWGDDNFANETGLNIQNQSNVDDWPCFAKYYITFPLGTVPAGKKILKATLELHQWGGSGDVLGGHPPQPSYIQVFTVGRDFNPATISWNNAPPALENVSGAWVDAETDYSLPWPKYPRDWDVTRAAAAAYNAGGPLRLAMYDSDSEFNSGKYFSTSEVQEWNATGRPTLIIEWGN